MNEPTMSAVDRQAWAAPTTLRGLGEVCARWLTRDGVASQPAYEPGSGPEPETHQAMIQTLAAVNRIGYFTVSSQPGRCEPDGAYNGERLLQRAAVTGFGSEELADAMRTLAERYGLLITFGKLGDGDDVSFAPPVDVTYVGAAAVTWFGWPLSREDIRDPDCGYGICSPAAQEALCDAWQVTMVDPVPGRDTELWAALDGLHTLVRLREK